MRDTEREREWERVRVWERPGETGRVHRAILKLSGRETMWPAGGGLSGKSQRNIPLSPTYNNATYHGSPLGNACPASPTCTCTKGKTCMALINVSTTDGCGHGCLEVKRGAWGCGGTMLPTSWQNHPDCALYRPLGDPDGCTTHTLNMFTMLTNLTHCQTLVRKSKIIQLKSSIKRLIQQSN